MNKIVHGIYPVDELPTGLREALKPAQLAEVTAKALPTASAGGALRRLAKRFDSLGLFDESAVVPVSPKEIRKIVRPRSVTARNAVRRVRRLRDKGDD